MAYRKANGQLSLYEKLLSLGIKTHIVLSFIILGFIILSYIFVIPWLGEKTVVLIPDSFDDQLGSMFFEQNTFFDTTDNAKTQTLNLFAQELKLKNKKKLQFIVIDSKIKNAFALPDGTIVVYTGILDLMSSYEELVGLIGHEVAHVNQRHSMKMLCRNLSGYLFVSTVLGDANGVMAVVGDNVNTLQSLSFSREFEREADVEGFKIVTENGVNPNGLPKLFKKLNQGNALEIPEFLSSHPITTERIQYIEDLVKKKGYQTKQSPKLVHLFKKLKN
jgi:predicted Zn-dependent protease